MSSTHVLVTGDSEGLGNALVGSLLRCDASANVVGISRRPDRDVCHYDSFKAFGASRYVRVQADLGRAAGVQHAVAQVRKTLVKAKAKLRAVVLVNGTGVLDSQVGDDPSLQEMMRQLNVAAPTAIVRGLMASPGVYDSSTRFFYYSGLVTHPSVTDPLLTRHAALKKEAVAELRRLLGAQLTCVMPGAYMTPMLRRAIVRVDSLLEWYTLPIADPYARGGLSDAVAHLATRERVKLPPTLIRPRINKLLVETHSAQQLSATLPAAIVRGARAVLEQTGQTDKQHDERVAFLEEHRSYGEDFPYAAIRANKLWPRWLSQGQARVLDGLALTR